MSDLERSIGAYYVEKKLSAERVEAILRQCKRPRFWQRHYKALSVAAVLVLFCAGVYRHVEQTQYKERVLAEIAMNHRKDLSVEVEATQYRSLQEKLDSLDFDLAPSPVHLAGLALVVGRYCSIQGKLAAQLKVFDPASAEMLTLYVTSLDGALAQLTPLDEEYEMLHMRCWRDGDRFFALAGYKPRGP